MLLYNTDTLQLITSTSGAIDVHVSYADYLSTTSTITPRPQNTAITTATTSSICNAPGTNTVRTVQNVNIRNKGTDSVGLTALHSSSLSVELYKSLIGPQEQLQYNERTGWEFVTSGTVDSRAYAPIIATDGMIWIDGTYGSDSIGTREDFNRPFKTVAAALAVAQAQDLVRVRPGTYAISPFTMPANVTLQGEVQRRCQLSYTATGSCTLVTMTTGSIVRNLGLALTSTGHYNLNGIYWGDSSIDTAFVQDVHITVDNSSAVTTGTSSINGFLIQSTGTQLADHYSFDSVVRVSSSGAGPKRGVLLDTSVCTCILDETDVSVISTGSINAIGVEVNKAGATLRYKSGVVTVTTGMTAPTTNGDISQTAGELRVGSGVTLVDCTTKQLAFTPIGQSSVITFADDGQVPASGFLRPGAGASSATESFCQIRNQGTRILQGLTFTLATAPGLGNTCTIKVRINGVDTGVTATASGTATSASDFVNAIRCVDGDLISISVADSGASAELFASLGVSSW